MTVLTTSKAHWPCLCRCERNDVRVTGPNSPSEEHVNYEVEVGYVKVRVPAPSRAAYVMHDIALFACTGMLAQQSARMLLSMP